MDPPWALLFVLLAMPAWGQTGQYFAPGSLASVPEPAADRAKNAAKEARWRWGPFRVEPRLSLSNLGYETNVLAAPGEDERSDLRAALGAGLSAYLEVGPKTILSGYVTPEYTWWRTLDELSQLNVNSGMGLFGFFNRMQLAVRATSTERESPLSSEVDVPVQTRVDSVSLETELEIRSRLRLLSRLSTTEHRLAREIEELRSDTFIRQLDRDSSTLEAQIGLELRSGLELGLGARRTETEFLDDPGGRSNSGTSPLLAASLRGRRSQIAATLVFNDLEFTNPDLPRFRSETGSVTVVLAAGSDSRVSLYAGRGLVFGAEDAASTFEETRYGVAFHRPLGRRTQLSLLAETGDLRFNDPRGVNAGRIDDVGVVAAGFLFDVTEKLVWRVQFSDIRYESNVRAFDRSTTRLVTGLAITEDLLPW